MTGLAPEIPEDLYMLIKKVASTSLCSIPFYFLCHERENGADQCQAVAVRKHLERNRKDKDSKFRLILIESRIHRLSRCKLTALLFEYLADENVDYKSVGVLPPTWRYESATASTMVA